VFHISPGISTRLFGVILQEEIMSDNVKNDVSKIDNSSKE